MVKFLTIFYLVRDTKLYSGPELPKSIIFNRTVYFKKKTCGEKVFLFNVCNIKLVFFLGILEETE